MAQIPSTMRALRFHEYGGPEVLRFDDDVPVPTPGPGEVLVKVAGSGVNPVDWKLREGHLKEVFPTELPAIVSWDFSGTVVALGKGVTELQEGDEVIGFNRSGTCAEYCVAPVAATALKPVSMDLADSAGIPIAAQTAYQALHDAAGVQPGQRVLIHAAAGGVGSFAVQFAKLRGAYVIATASKDNHHLVQELGADEIIDYRETPFETVVKDIDVVLETVGGEQTLRSLSVLKPGGVLVAIAGAEPAEEAAREGKRTVPHYLAPNREQLQEISYMIQDVRIRPVIDAVIPFHEAVEAQKESQTGHVRGKLVIRVS